MSVRVRCCTTASTSATATIRPRLASHAWMTIRAGDEVVSAGAACGPGDVLQHQAFRLGTVVPLNTWNQRASGA